MNILPMFYIMQLDEVKAAVFKSTHLSLQFVIIIIFILFINSILFINALSFPNQMHSDFDIALI